MVGLELYIDSSVWNCYFNDHVPDLQAQTREFFERVGAAGHVQLNVSDVVLQELGNAPPERFALLGKLVARTAPARLQLDEEAVALAERYVQYAVLSAGHIVDALHVAIATVREVDALVSWNYRHLVNRRRREAFNGVNAIVGYRAIEIVSPPEVLDD